MAWRVKNGWCRDINLERRLGAFAGVTTRRLGDMGSVRTFGRALRRAGLPGNRWVSGKQVHGRRVRRVVRPSAPGFFPATDGFLTRERGLALCVRSADCVPVFIADSSSPALGLVHAGWRGVRAGILTAAVRHMRRAFGSRGRSLTVSIGPHIRSCCYEVGPDVAARFRNRPGAVVRRRGPSGPRLFLSMERALRAEAARAGVSPARFFASPHCTAHDRRFFSYRRDRTSERMAAVFVLKD
jgi:polyphenol oxidase